VNYGVLTQRVLKGGTDEEILDWCYTNGRRLNEGDLVVWNAFVSKLGWNDFASPVLDEQKQKSGAAERSDINTVADLIDFEEKRKE
jgi:gluconokinase